MPNLKQKDDDVLGILDMLKKQGPEDQTQGTMIGNPEEEEDEELELPIFGGGNPGGARKGPNLY